MGFHINNVNELSTVYPEAGARARAVADVNTECVKVEQEESERWDQMHVCECLLSGALDTIPRVWFIFKGRTRSTTANVGFSMSDTYIFNILQLNS